MDGATTAAAVSAAASIVLATLTYQYVRLTRRLVDEQRASNDVARETYEAALRAHAERAESDRRVADARLRELKVTLDTYVAAVAPRVSVTAEPDKPSSWQEPVLAKTEVWRRAAPSFHYLYVTVRNDGHNPVALHPHDVEGWTVYGFDRLLAAGRETTMTWFVPHDRLVSALDASDDAFAWLGPLRLVASTPDGLVADTYEVAITARREEPAPDPELLRVFQPALPAHPHLTVFRVRLLDRVVDAGSSA